MHLPHPAAQRHVQIGQCLRADSSIRVPAKPALKILDRVHKRALINRSIGRNIRVSRKVAHQPEQSDQLRDARISIAGRNRFFYGRKLFAVVFLRELQVGLQGLNRAPVTRVGRFHLRQDAGNIRRIHNMFFQEFGQIVFLGLDVETKVKMLRIHLADVKVGDISHHANGERGIELHGICF